VPVVMETSRTGHSHAARSSRRAIPAFTLIDLLVSMAIIAVLISLLLPSLSGIREATRRVICSSNERQQGLGLAMYAEDWKDELPPTEWDPKDAAAPTPRSPQNTNIVRSGDPGAKFDGLGILFAAEYLNAPQVFYCPSHHGLHPYATYAADWHADQGKIVVNFQYRGGTRLAPSQADRLTLLTDGLATRNDYSHNVGSNVLRADYSVSWLPDPSGSIARLLPESDSDANAATKVSDAWNLIESPTSGPAQAGP
jgi:type II secretory pathway pseudopilin PulG